MERIVDIVLGAVLGGSLVAVYALRVFIAVLRDQLNAAERSRVSRPRAPRVAAPPQEETLPLEGLEVPAPPPPPPVRRPRTNFDPSPQKIPLARPSMRQFLWKLQQREAGPIAEKKAAS